MNDSICSFEAETARAARSGRWPAALESHVNQCDACRQTRSVASFMGRVATESATDDPLPDPTRIWLRSRLADQGEEERRLGQLQRGSRAFISLAIAATGWAALEWVPQIIAEHSDTLGLAGASAALTAAIVYVTAVRPLRNAR